MSNDYFVHSTNIIPAGTRARTSQVNAIAAEIEDGFDKMPSLENLTQGNTHYLADTGAADVYAVTFAAPLVPSGYVDGMQLDVKISVTNTGAATINVNALGAKTIARQTGDALLADTFIAGNIYSMIYSLTAGEFRLKYPVRTSRTSAGTEVVIG